MKSEEKVHHSLCKSFDKVVMKKFVWIVNVSSEFAEVSWFEIFSSKKSADAFASAVKHPKKAVFARVSKKMVR